jgi:hypothetical protein
MNALSKLVRALRHTAPLKPAKDKPVIRFASSKAAAAAGRSVLKRYERVFRRLAE